MLDIFGSVKGFLKLDSVNIDNNIFRLHYKLTVIMLIIFSLIVTSRQYIGDPIHCTAKGVPEKVMDSYCWTHSTFTIPDRMTSDVVGFDVAHPGVGPQRQGDSVKYHKYYQWVCFVLFFQALLFYIPRFLWKTWEAGRMKTLAHNLNYPIFTDDTNKSERIKLLVDYFASNLHHHNFYAIRFFICEVLNFINVVGQIFLVDYFLGGEFSTYGFDVFRMATELDPDERVDPMAKVFPKVTKCTFHKFGPSGTPERIDGLCVLPINIFNEKIYVILWFWLIILAAVTGLSLLYRLVVILCARARMYFLRTQARLAPRREVELVASKCQIGDWFVLLNLGKNIDPLVYQELICELAYRIEGQEPV